MSLEQFGFKQFTSKDIDAMPDKFRSGMAFIEDNDLKTYAFITMTSCLFFHCWYMFIRHLHISNNYFDQSLAKKSNDEKYWVVQGWVIVTHHSIVPILITLTLYNSCSNPDGLPWPSLSGGSYSTPQNPKHFGYLRSEDCFMEVNKGFAMILSFTLGFLIQDLCNLLICIED